MSLDPTSQLAEQQQQQHPPQDAYYTAMMSQAVEPPPPSSFSDMDENVLLAALRDVDLYIAHGMGQNESPPAMGLPVAAAAVPPMAQPAATAAGKPCLSPPVTPLRQANGPPLHGLTVSKPTEVTANSKVKLFVHTDPEHGVVGYRPVARPRSEGGRATRRRTRAAATPSAPKGDSSGPSDTEAGAGPPRNSSSGGSKKKARSASKGKQASCKASKECAADEGNTHPHHHHPQQQQDQQQQQQNSDRGNSKSDNRRATKKRRKDAGHPPVPIARRDAEPHLACQPSMGDPARDENERLLETMPMAGAQPSAGAGGTGSTRYPHQQQQPLPLPPPQPQEEQRTPEPTPQMMLGTLPRCSPAGMPPAGGSPVAPETFFSSPAASSSDEEEEDQEEGDAEQNSEDEADLAGPPVSNVLPLQGTEACDGILPHDTRHVLGNEISFRTYVSILQVMQHLPRLLYTDRRCGYWSLERAQATLACCDPAQGDIGERRRRAAAAGAVPAFCFPHLNSTLAEALALDQRSSSQMSITLMAPGSRLTSRRWPEERKLSSRRAILSEVPSAVSGVDGPPGTQLAPPSVRISMRPGQQTGLRCEVPLHVPEGAVLARHGQARRGQQAGLRALLHEPQVWCGFDSVESWFADELPAGREQDECRQRQGLRFGVVLQYRGRQIKRLRIGLNDLRYGVVYHILYVDNTLRDVQTKAPPLLPDQLYDLTD